MKPSQVIYSLLSVDAGVAALVGPRINAVDSPEGDALPRLICSQVSDAPQLPIGANAATYPCTGRVQVDCLASTAKGAKQLAEAVRTACHLKSGTIASIAVSSVVWDSDGPDAFNYEINTYHQPVDFLINYYR